jgi:dihydroorotate dehydrogenase (fumarate)
MVNDIDIQTDIAGCQMITPIYNASGCWCTTYEELDELSVSDAGGIVSKSSTIEPRKGNPEPRRHIEPFGSINSMGVPNYGYVYYSKFVSEKPYFQSVIPFSLDEMKTILIDLDDRPRLIEINLSCPNIINKTIVGYDPTSIENYLADLRELKLKNLTIGLKLPPYYEHSSFIWVSNLILEYSDVISFITCINSIVDGLIVDGLHTAIHPKGGFGGIGGIYCKPTALANVRRFYLLLGSEIDIIGCGGVVSGKDVFDHILCGASAVQVGTQLVTEGPQIFSRLNKELKKIMDLHGFKSINDFLGKLDVKASSVD